MANMSYCRFENTLKDLGDCYNALLDMVDKCYEETDLTEWEQLADMSEYEWRAIKQMYKLCDKFVREYSDIATELDERKIDAMDDCD